MKPFIFFIYDKKSYLPEIFAYEKHCKENSISYKIVDSSFDFKKINEPHIKWTFMGLDLKKNKNSFIVHEYLSLSIGRFKKTKNYIKKYLSTKPDIQIFLNETIRNTFHINGIPYTIRDMGIDDAFFKNTIGINKEYDFCYCGSMDKSREIDKLLDLFTSGVFKNNTILLLGSAPKDLTNKYHNENIHFHGKVDYTDVPRILSKAKCAINYIPNKYPFNIQTSTKFLEYLALGLPVISTKYHWVDKFQEKNKFSCSYLHELTELSITTLINSKYTAPDMSEFKWKNIIKNSKVFDIVIEGFNKKFNI
ncbi:glycosyltransferase [Providencia rettgeri]|nr:glycosyltransferase [Providencia rettgeri]